MTYICKTKALFDFDAESEDDLAFKKGEIIKILTKDGEGWLKDSGWWEGELNSKTGIFPKEFVEEISEEKEQSKPAAEPEPIKKVAPTPAPAPEPEPIVSSTSDDTLEITTPTTEDEAIIPEETHAHIPNHMKFGKAMPGLAPGAGGGDPLAELKSKLKKQGDTPGTAAPPKAAATPSVAESPKLKKAPVTSNQGSSPKLETKAAAGDEKPEANPFGAFGLPKKPTDLAKPDKTPLPAKKPEDKKEEEDPSAHPFKQFGVGAQAIPKRPVSAASPTPDSKPAATPAKQGQEKEGPKRTDKGSAPPRPTTQKPIKNADIPKELKSIDDKPSTEPVTSSFEKKIPAGAKQVFAPAPKVEKVEKVDKPKPVVVESKPVEPKSTKPDKKESAPEPSKQVNWDTVVADGKTKVKAIFEFKAIEADELSFSAGDEILLVEKVDDLWLRGEKSGKVGIFPKEFVNPMSTGLVGSTSSPNLNKINDDVSLSDSSDSFDSPHPRLEVLKKAGGPANRRPPSRKANFVYEEGSPPEKVVKPEKPAEEKKPVEKTVDKAPEDKKPAKAVPAIKPKENKEKPEPKVVEKPEPKVVEKPVEPKVVEKPVEPKVVEKPVEPKVEEKPKEEITVAKIPAVKMPAIKTSNTVIVTLKESSGNFRSIENLPEGTKRMMFNFENEGTEYAADTVVVAFKDGALDAVYHNNKKIPHALKLV